MFKQIQNYINLLIVCLTLSNFSFSQIEGCTDLEAAYNCADDVIEAGNEYPNYIFDIGGTKYDNSCNWDWNLGEPEPVYVGGCVEGICQEIIYFEDTEEGEGYYNPTADTDDGSCRYYQSPHGVEVVFNVTPDAINVNWSTFDPPANATIEFYIVQRCADNGCIFIPGFMINDVNTATFFSDDYNYSIDEEIKYAIGVKYSKNPYWGFAIGASYIYPPNIGDVNGDGFVNVMDIVTLANCVLTSSCGDITYSYACDLNDDGGWNVMDIVTLANCVLTSTCS